MASVTIAGSGWLRTGEQGSSTARYRLTLSDESGVDGEICGEMAMMIEAVRIGRATLVLESGRAVRLDVLRRSPQGLSVHADHQGRHAAFRNG